MSIYRRVFAYYRPDLGATVGAMALTLIANGFNILRPWPLAFIVDKVLPVATRTPHGITLAGHDLGAWSVPTIIGFVCTLMVIFHILAGGIGYIVSVITIRVGLHGLMRLRTELYAYLHSLPLKFHDQRRSADSSFRVAYDSQSVQAFYSKGFFIFQSVLSLVTTFAAMWYFDWTIALLSLLVVPFMMLAIYLYAKRIRAQSTTFAEMESAVLTVAQEGLSSIKMVQAFGREADEVEQFQTSARQSLHANLLLNSTSMKSALLIGTLIAISSAAMYYVGALHVLSGKLTVGQIWYLSTLLLMLYQPLEALTHIAWAFQGAAAGAQRCFEVLEKENDVPDAPDATVITTSRGEIVFDNVAFGYTSEREILHDVNLRIEAGRTVAFVGGTGAGKSTLLSLVPRFYDPDRRSGANRRPRPALDHEKIAPRPDQHRPPGHAAFLHNDPRKHRLRPPRRHRSRDHRSRQTRPGGRLHHGHARRLQQPGRRARRPSQRRPAPAHRHRARLFEKRPDPDSRRTDQRARPDHRSRDHGDHRGTHAQPHHAHHHAPHRHDPSSRQNRRSRQRHRRRRRPRP
jgi:ATP-binding cassette subfamily B protein